MAPWAVCCRTLEQHQEMHFPQSGVMHFSFAEDLHLCILLPSGEPPSPPPIYSRSLERKKVQAFCLLQIFFSDIRTT